MIQICKQIIRCINITVIHTYKCIIKYRDLFIWIYRYNNRYKYKELDTFIFIDI